VERIGKRAWVSLAHTADTPTFIDSGSMTGLRGGFFRRRGKLAFTRLL
jgi:hypothetical protein